MNTKGLKLATVLLTGAVMLTSMPMDMLAGNEEGIDEYVAVSASFSAGAHAAIRDAVVLDDTDIHTFLAGVTTHDVPLVAEPLNEYANIGIAQVDESLNIRSSADPEAEVLGKLYANGACTVLETLDGWYKIESGSVVGYVSSDYVTVGDEAVCKAASERIGTITTGGLKLREAATTDSDIKDLLEEGKKVTVIDESEEGWVKVSYASKGGYVSAEYIDVKTVYTYAESKEEEAARLKAEEAARKKAEEERRKAEEEKKKKENKKDTTKKEDKKYTPPTGGSGQAVADYAVQFVGNPYVYGGTSLTNGIDCSGFVMRIYEAFGVSLPRTSYDQRFVGYAVSASEIQPGDIVCYSGHVAIYIGNGKIVHAANKNDGIKITNKWNYTKVVAIRRIF